MSPQTYSIVIPAYNESRRIRATLDKLLAYIGKQHWIAEVVVVNDGSTDDTEQIIRDYAKQHSNIRLIENPGNRGKGYSVRNGMLHATGDIVIFSDADLSAPIYEAPKLLAAIEAGADVAIGSRWLDPSLQTERQPFHRQLFGRAFNLALRLILGLKFKDTQCGFKAFTHQAAQQVFARQRIERWGFDPEILFLCQKFGLNMKEIAVEWAHGEGSKINPVVDGMKMVGEMFKIRIADLTGKYNRGVPTYAATSYTK